MPTFDPAKAFTTKKKVIAPEPLIEDEIEAVVNAEPIPHGMKEVVVHVTPPAPTKARSCGVTNFEAACVFVENLATFDFDDPHGLDGVTGSQFKNYHAVLLESVGQRSAAHDLFSEIGCRIGEDHLTRKAATPEQLKSAITMFVDRHADLSKPGPQFRITDWQILPLAVPKPPQTPAVQSPSPSAPITPTKMACRLCYLSVGAEPHDCNEFMEPELFLRLERRF